MTTQQFFTMLYLIIHQPYSCIVQVRAPGFWTHGSPGFQVYTATVYGGSCIQSFWMTFGHPTLDWIVNGPQS